MQKPELKLFRNDLLKQPIKLAKSPLPVTHQLKNHENALMHEHKVQLKYAELNRILKLMRDEENRTLLSKDKLSVESNSGAQPSNNNNQQINIFD